VNLKTEIVAVDLRGRASHLTKNISFHPSGKSSLQACAILPDQEGRFAIVTNVGAGCDGRVGVARRAAPVADGEVVWS
jgi:hypothetical protein